MKSITATYIIGNKNKGTIGRIKELSNTITKDWDKIIKENVIPKSATRNYDMKGLLTEIQSLAEERALMKLYIQCINIGFTKFTELPKNNNYYNIFLLSEKNEQMFKLCKIKTLNPKLKRAKGKKALEETEELTSDYIKSLKNKLQLEINKLEKDIENFNNKAELEIESPASLLAA